MSVCLRAALLIRSLFKNFRHGGRCEVPVLLSLQEMALQSRVTERISAESLEKWEEVGSGGFGRVYKARHKTWKINVAVKLLHDGFGYIPEYLYISSRTNFQTSSCISIC